jgi:hypothetical protein
MIVPKVEKVVVLMPKLMRQGLREDMVADAAEIG